MDAYAVLVERPYNLIVVERLEVVLVEDFNLSLLDVLGGDAHVLVNLLHFIILCLGGEVGAHHAVHAERAVVGLVAEVAAVGPEALAGGLVVIVHGLVHPVPDGAADEEIGAFDGVPVVDEVTAGIAHGVGILGDVVGILHVVFSLDGTLHPRDGRILVGAHVDDVVVAFILHGAAGVESLDGLVGSHEVVARAGLVAQAPDADGRMVDGGMHHFHVAGHVGILQFDGVRRTFLAVVILVAFDVGFVLQVDAIFVAEVIPVGGAGIVGVAHVVDVAALHEHDFLRHPFAGDGVSAVGIGFMTVDALHLDGLSVQIVVASGQSELVLVGRRVLDFDFAEADDGGVGFDHAALLVLELSHEGVAVGALGAPGLHLVAGLEGEGHFLGGAAFERVERGFSADAFHEPVLVAVELVLVERIAQAVVLGLLLVEVVDEGADVERSLGVGVVIFGDGYHVAHLHHRLCGERHRAVDTRQTEHVLRLEEGTVAVAVHLGGHHVLALHQIVGDIELGQVAGVFRKTYVLAVDVEVEERVDAVEVDVDLAAVPAFGHGEGAAVGAHFVAVLVGGPVLGWCAHDALLPVVYGNLMFEDDALVGIDGHTILERSVLLDAGDVPVHGHLHLVPAAGVELGFVEVLRTLVGVGRPVELPFAVEGLPVFAVFGQDLAGALHTFEGEEPGMRLFLVVGQRVDTLPFPAAGGSHVAIIVALKRGHVGHQWSSEAAQQKCNGCLTHKLCF